MSDPAFKVPPHSLEAEQSVLGALLLDNQAFERISDLLTSEDFYKDDHRRIWRHISKLIESNRPADVVTVHEAIEDSEDRGKTGGPAYLGQMAEGTPSALNIRRYAELVRDKSVQRRLLHATTMIAEAAMAPAGVDVQALLEEAEATIMAVRDAAPGSNAEIVHIGRACTEYCEWVDEHPKGIETGLADFDSLTGGLQPGNLVIVAGRPSMGKTTLALQMAEHICAGVPGIMFSLEASRREVAGRMVEWHRHKAGRDAAVDKVFKLKLFVDDSASISPGVMRARLRRMKRQHGVSLVVVDYLQLVRGKGDNREQEVASISRDLKAIAKDFQVPVVALSQLSRNVEQRVEKRPGMSDLRESGAIEQDADMIIFPFRPDYYDVKFNGTLAEAELIIAKNRNNGRVGTARVMFSRELNRFGDYIPERFRAEVA